MTYATEYRCEPCGVGWHGQNQCWSCGERAKPMSLPSAVNPYRPNPARVGPLRNP